MARSASDQRHRRPSREPRTSVGGMRHARFVTHVDDFEPRTRRRCQDFIQMVADECEDPPDTERLQRTDEQFRAARHRGLW